jgi:hypothetical protein
MRAVVTTQPTGVAFAVAVAVGMAVVLVVRVSSGAVTGSSRPTAATSVHVIV